MLKKIFPMAIHICFKDVLFSRCWCFSLKLVILWSINILSLSLKILQRILEHYLRLIWEIFGSAPKLSKRKWTRKCITHWKVTSGLRGLGKYRIPRWRSTCLCLCQLFLKLSITFIFLCLKIIANSLWKILKSRLMAS